MSGVGDPSTARRVRWLQLRESMRETFFAALHDVGSPLAADADIARQLDAQFASIADAVALAAGIIGDGHGEADPSEDIGRSRAASGLHPTQSLRAASLVFEVILPTLAREFSARDEVAPELTAARLLNSVILARLASAYATYVDYLLDKAHGSNRDERRWLSRELHDVAAPSVAVVLQKLELYELYRDTDPRRADAKLREMRESLLDAVHTIRSLSAQTRDTVARHGLGTAIERLLEDVPKDIQTGLTIVGDLEAVSLAYREEFFLMTREAVRNAVSHAMPSRIDIAIRMTASELTGQIHNDGRHFDVVAALAAERHVGLDSMRERALLLGGELGLTSSAAQGTAVSITIPLAGPAITTWPRKH
jgi:signal transduction histidine kinase